MVIAAEGTFQALQSTEAGQFAKYRQEKCLCSYLRLDFTFAKCSFFIALPFPSVEDWGEHKLEPTPSSPKPEGLYSFLIAVNCWICQAVGAGHESGKFADVDGIRKEMH
jgi:hypothetical protein